MLSDEELLRLRSADNPYFTALNRRFTPKFRHYVGARIGRPDDVDDILQETWLRVFRRRKAFRNQAPLDSWLWSICRHTCTDWLRAKRRRSMLAERIKTAADEWPPHSTLDQPLRRDDAFRVLLGRVDQALFALSDRQFDTLIYRGILGHPTNLTAKLMHVAPGTVKATLHQAAKRVRAQVPAELVDEWIDAAG